MSQTNNPWQTLDSKIVYKSPLLTLYEGENPLAAAMRELEEETGFKAKKWTKIGSVLNPNKATVFLAEELEKSQDKMSEDGIECFLQLTRADLDNMITSGKLTGSKTLACLTLFDRHASERAR